jgi:hypothetical protein
VSTALRATWPAAALLTLATTGCALAAFLYAPPRLASCPGLVPSTAMLPAGDYVLRSRVRIVGGDVDVGYELVAEKRGDELVVVGFNSFGAKAFAVTQRGVEVESRSYLGPALQVPPENVLRDLHAAHFAEVATAKRSEIARPGCGYTATFVAVSRRELP